MKALVNMKSFIKIATFLYLLTEVIGPSHAEYRVYQYLVTNTNELLNGEKSFIRTTTLDPVSFISYHGGRTSIKLDMLRTWICPGYTGNYQPTCPSPYGQMTEEVLLE